MKYLLRQVLTMCVTCGPPASASQMLGLQVCIIQVLELDFLSLPIEQGILTTCIYLLFSPNIIILTGKE
jgi:hypothetical protein